MKESEYMDDEKRYSGTTVFMTGGSRGIGLAIAEKLASEGANIAFLAKTDAPDPRLPGTVHTAAATIEEAGGNALPITGDVRDDEAVASAVSKTVDRFGGIDIVINNASAIALQGIGELPTKRYDLMQDINVRGTFVVLSETLPFLLESSHPRVLSLSPPLNLDRQWFTQYAPYTLSKYGMTMLTIGLAEQYRSEKIAANCLWPKTLIATAALQNVGEGEEGVRASRRPEIVADAAAEVLKKSAAEATGECFIDEDVLRESGLSDFSRYSFGDVPEDCLQRDLFL